MFPYAAYHNFFAIWFNNVVFITFAFLLWLVITVHWAFFVLKGRTLWLRVPPAFIVSAVHYLIFGLLIAGGQFGGEANFLYEPAHISENMSIYHGWQLIALWPLSLLTTGGYLIVLPVLIFGWGFWYSRSSRRKRST